ncbi:Choline transport system permease protein OpuBB [Maioricimonas rarisocia]|uniref:Choline transport system permease protein OpuBB n=1 Tax=Maioricimonas rarisocia TaxID=2528026 RepID=A0A517Z8C2_9PLAN|nr:glycine betaine ABC transporter substrate-binding protein [Maioricimonas rarisocia]QDU38740.1 Choline transport system permease protein OpuBB [Maioricimonas rarisocia]
MNIRSALPTLFVIAALFAGLHRSSEVIAQDQPTTVRIGSKSFTESVVLGEILSRLAEDAGAGVIHRTLGGTPVVWHALLAGEIDCYVEYTGTIKEEVLKGESITSTEQMRAELAERGVRMSEPLGFNNTYALAVSREIAEMYPDLKTISDLRRYPDLDYGFGNEFMRREDGWRELSAAYGLPRENASGLDHDLAYRGLDAGSIDVMDVYTTDAEIEYYDIHVLEDDLRFFPEYEAVILYRDELQQQSPEIVDSMLRLEGTLDASRMSALNARSKIDQVPEPIVAADFVREEFGIESQVDLETRPERLLRYTIEHLQLVGISVTAAILLAVPLGILAARVSWLGQLVLSAVGILQTIPSLAMFVILIPLLGVGPVPAIAALFLYSLLPIVRNTYTGLHDISPPLMESAEALGLPSGARLRLIELPLASRAILAGVKTAAVINIGTATLGGLINAGGYGEPIFAGIRLDRNDLLLEGAIPAALMALAAQGLFELLERWLVPKGLRGGSTASE